ncbi:hypothetical protein OsI_36918 [Oryza sativa Indica Group]|uniref:Uncharacterized protein n=1 Tax=Oryza sativa subsp. indica TaxID=39946 RepID=B8BLP5_ORYSI|nr:hypothetical protein OsI_36918 [Oryza sativa Indica Group]
MANAPRWSMVSPLPRGIIAPRRKESHPCRVCECCRRSAHLVGDTALAPGGIDEDARWVVVLPHAVALACHQLELPRALPPWSRSRSSLPCGSGELEASQWGRRRATDASFCADAGYSTVPTGKSAAATFASICHRRLDPPPTPPQSPSPPPRSTRRRGDRGMAARRAPASFHAAIASICHRRIDPQLLRLHPPPPGRGEAAMPPEKRARAGEREEGR